MRSPPGTSWDSSRNFFRSACSVAGSAPGMRDCSRRGSRPTLALAIFLSPFLQVAALGRRRGLGPLTGLMPLVKTGALDVFPQRALFAKIDAALQADLFRFGGVVHNIGGQAIQQLRRYPQLFRGTLAENLLKLLVPGR